MALITSHITYSLRSAVEADRPRLNHLMHFELHVHRHLDWRSPLDWLGREPFMVAEVDGSIEAVLGCPIELPDVVWIQVFAASRQVTLRDAWTALWSEVHRLLIAHGVQRAAAIPLDSWFSDLLEESGFKYSHDVLFLQWDYRNNLPPLKTGPLLLRVMRPEDLPAVHRIDTASFRPIWQNSPSALAVAYEQAAIATVAELDAKVVGYQISTSTYMGGHLARLAVLPDHQGKKIGSRLVLDLLQRFIQRGIFRVTVNTQCDNIASLKLYDQIGFRQTGESYRVLEAQLV
jgi:ribosomal-protein-alanine N-acetyltransferase